MSKWKTSNVWRMLIVAAMAVLTVPVVTEAATLYPHARDNALYPPGIGFNALVDYDLANFSQSPNIRKFVNRLPGLGLPGCTVGNPLGTGTCNENNLGQYIPAAQADTTTYPGSDYFELGIAQSTVQMHSDLPPTTFRGYYQKNGVDHSKQFDGVAIIAHRDRPTRLKVWNELGIGVARSALLGLAVDTTLIGSGNSTNNSLNTTEPQNRVTIHLHGGATPWISDGTPHTWFSPPGDPAGKGPGAVNVPDMVNGSVVNGVAVPCIGGAACYNPTGTDGIQTYYYSNAQSSRLMFYHDHAVAITRLNVYAGLAAPYLVTDNFEEDLISGTNTSGANPTNAKLLPDLGGKYHYGIPLVVQDKAYVNDATTPPGAGFPAPETGYMPQYMTQQTDPLWYTWVGWGGGSFWEGHEYMPVENPFDPTGNTPTGRWDYGPFLIPPAAPLNLTLPSPTIIPEGFMDTAVINGTAFPYVELPPDVVRFRILNGCDSRSLNLQLYKADPLRINVTSGGSGYTSAPAVTVSGPGTATATATVTSGIVTAIDVTNAQGYPADSQPTVTIAAPGSGTQATAVAVVATEVKMVPASPNAAHPTWPIDGRDGGVPDPTTAGPPWIQIGNEAGFLAKVAVTPQQPVDYELSRQNIPFLGVTGKSLLLMPAMRADVLVDLSQYHDGDTLIVYNDAPAPMPGFWPLNDYYTDDPDLSATGGAVTTPPGFGPNTRTYMQIRIKGTKISSLDYHSDAVPGFTRGAPNVGTLPAVETPATDGASLKELKTILPLVFAAGEDKILVPQLAYNGAYPVGDPLHYNGATDHYVRGYETTYNVMGTSQTVASILATAPGNNYTTAPTVTLAGGFPAGCVAPACVPATATAQLNPIGAITLLTAGSGYTSAPTVTLGAPTAGGVTATANATISGGIVTNINIVDPGSNYTNIVTAPTCTIAGGGGTGATCSVMISTLNQVGHIAITNPGAGYVSQPQVFITGGGGTGAVAVARLSGDVAMTGKNITEGFDVEYGRLDIRLGSTPNPLTPNVGNGFVVGLARYIDPPTEIMNDGELVLWRFSHLGVDSHVLHFHLFNLQVINRVDWTNVIKQPYPDEIGWREVIRTNPQEDIIVAIKPYHMPLPFPLPNSVRVLDETTPLGSTTNFYPVPPPPGIPAVPQQSNVMTDFGWEYVWHCHLLGHEENDMMRPIVFVVATAIPPTPTLAAGGVTTHVGNVTLTWSEAATTTTNKPTGFIIQRATGASQTTGFTTIATTNNGVAGGATNYTYTDSTTASGQAYTYHVAAYNTVGTTANSANRNSATTPTWTAPTVSIVTPANNATFTEPATLSLTATATATGSTVSKVEYYYGTTLLGSSTGPSPYTVSFPNVMAGTMAITAKVYSAAGATAVSTAVNVTVNPAGPATMLTPANLSTLTGSSQLFTWTNVGAAFYQIQIGTTVGGYNIFNGPIATATTATATGLPTDGSTIYVRLWSQIGGTWYFNDYHYTAVSITPAVMSSPAVNGSTLTSSSFTWTNVGAAFYQIQIGTTVGGYNIFNGPIATATTATATGLPIDGSTIYVRLWSQIGGTWYFNDYHYTAVTATPAVMTTPAVNGSTLSGSSPTFIWSNVGAAFYQIQIGTTVGGYDVSNGPIATATTYASTGLPTNGSTVYVRLWSQISGTWSFNDYFYTTGP